MVLIQLNFFEVQHFIILVLFIYSGERFGDKKFSPSLLLLLLLFFVYDLALYFGITDWCSYGI